MATKTAPGRAAETMDAAAAETASAGQETRVQQVLVRSVSPAGPFRRCGREFSRDGVTIPVDQLTAQELETLQHEPMLSVAFVD